MNKSAFITIESSGDNRKFWRLPWHRTLTKNKKVRSRGGNSETRGATGDPGGDSGVVSPGKINNY